VTLCVGLYVAWEWRVLGKEARQGRWDSEDAQARLIRSVVAVAVAVVIAAAYCGAGG
jgi:hypothetical protein